MTGGGKHTDAELVAADAKRLGKRIPVNGKPIEHRGAQQLIHGGLAAVFFAAMVAGTYFAVTQVHWYIHIGSFNHGTGLKEWWDGGMGFIHSASWELYRHPYRDMGEPAVAVMGVKTYLAPPRYWGVRVGAARLIVTPLIVLALAFAMITGAVWLLDFGLPHIWPSAPVPARWWETLIAGALIGQILHFVWGPVGGTIQGELLDRSVDKHPHSIPLWVRKPDVAPVVRERWTLMSRHNTQVKTRKGIPPWILTTVVVVSVLLAALGLLGHFWIGTLGHSVPYLAP